MSVSVGVNGTKKNVSSVKCGVSGVVKNVSHGYNGVSGVRRQFWGLPTGLQYFLIVPVNIWMDTSSTEQVEIKYSNLQYISSSTSGSYTIYKFRTPTYCNYYVNIDYYKYNSRSYPRNYCADYVYYTISTTSSTKYSFLRGFIQNTRIYGIYNNETFTSLENGSGYPSSGRNSELNLFRSDGILPSTFSLTASLHHNVIGGSTCNIYEPSMYGYFDGIVSSWYNNTSVSITTNQSRSIKSNSDNRFSFGVLISENNNNTITFRVQIPSQTITFNGTSYPIYFSFAKIMNNT